MEVVLLLPQFSNPDPNPDPNPDQVIRRLSRAGNPTRFELPEHLPPKIQALCDLGFAAEAAVEARHPSLAWPRIG